MKKLNLVTALSITAGLAFAWNATAEDYGVYHNNTGSAVYEEGNLLNYLYNEGIGAWYIQYHPTETYNTAPETERTTLFKSLANGGVLSIAVERNDTAGFTFGTYTSDPETGAIISKTTLGTVKNVGENITIDPKNGVEMGSDGAVYSEAFNKNDLVGIWVQETGKDIIYYSNNKLTTDLNEGKQGIYDYVHYTDSRVEEAPATGYSSVFFDDSTRFYPENPYDPENNPARYEYGWPGFPTASIKFHITGVASDFASHPTGGPLPGVWATIALAGAASAYLKRRKKENK